MSGPLAVAAAYNDAMESLVTQLYEEALADPDAWSEDGWSRIAAVLAGRANEFLDWAGAHPRWSFVVAEASSEVCAKPPEAAAWVLHEIVDELLDH